MESLANGAQLSADTWDDFVKRLRNDCHGERVNDHCTASAIFLVQAKRLVYGIDTDYGGDKVILWDDQEWFNPLTFIKENLEYLEELQEAGSTDFELPEEYEAYSNWQLWSLVEELCDEVFEDVTITGYTEEWEYVNSHFTYDAAAAFIKRKKHDYRKGLRIYTDAQIHCWEYETIKEAILSGKLRYVE